jgi:hypothetical protein
LGKNLGSVGALVCHCAGLDGRNASVAGAQERATQASAVTKNLDVCSVVSLIDKKRERPVTLAVEKKKAMEEMMNELAMTNVRCCVTTSNVRSFFQTSNFFRWAQRV